MEKIKVIKVRYLNQSEEHPLSRPHKIKMITKKDGSIVYRRINDPKTESIDPKSFVTDWYNKGFKTNKQSNKKETPVWEEIRVKFVFDNEKLSRPKKVYKITNGNIIEYAPYGIRGTAKRIHQEMIFEWEEGPTPTPKPSRKYPKEYLIKLGYKEELIQTFTRGFSSKDIDSVAKKLNISRKQAREKLTTFGCVSKVLKDEKTLLNKRKERQLEAQKSTIHMGEYTHHKEILLAKPGSRRFRKLIKKGLVNNKGYWVGPKPKNEKAKRSKKRR